MTTPYAHTHVAHLTRTKRRRSQSLTIPNSSEQENIQEQSIQPKQFLIQLLKERAQQNEKHKDYQRDEDDVQPTVTRIHQIRTSKSSKKHTSSMVTVSVPVKRQMSATTAKTRPTEANESYQSVVTRIAGLTSTMSTKKHTLSTGTTKDVTPMVKNRIQMQDDENYDDPYSQDTEVPQLKTIKSTDKQFPTTTGNNSSIGLSKQYQDPKVDSSISYNDIECNSTQTSYNPLATSSTNIISKSKIFDQEFYLDDNKDHVRTNDAKSHGHIVTSEREKYYAVHGKRLTTRSSASFMVAIIAIIIGVIAFALGLAAFILVLLLRSSVDARLVMQSLKTSVTIPGTNSTATTPTSGSLPSSCSAYTAINDPTRSVFAAGAPLGCDTSAPFINLTNPVWIRFRGSGGTTLPLTTPGMNLCGSEGTGWYDGVMPSSTGQMFNGTACFSWYTNVCRYSVSVSVTNCGSFYIYLLPPAPACMMRYCTI